jgi:CBS domain-containing protein
MVELYVDSLMSRPVETVESGLPLADAAAAMIEHDVGALVVVDDGSRIAGLVTATDFVRLAREGRWPAGATVGDVVRTDLVTTTRGARVSEVIDAMLENLIHHVPVVDGDEVVGMVSTLDLAAHLDRSL